MQMSLKPHSIFLVLYSALIGGVVLSILLMIFGWYTDWQLIHKPVPKQSLTLNTNNADIITQLPNLHLFGQTLTKVEEMPISALQLHITGIVKMLNDTNQMISKAYISIANGPSKIYHRGDTLPDGVKIYEITNDTVILQNGEHLEKISLARDPLIFKSKQTEERA